MCYAYFSPLQFMQFPEEQAPISTEPLTTGLTITNKPDSRAGYKFNFVLCWYYSCKQIINPF